MRGSLLDASVATKMGRRRMQLDRLRASRGTGHSRSRSRSRSPGLEACHLCGMVYSTARSSDQRQHARYHGNRLDSSSNMTAVLDGGGSRRTVKSFFNGDRIFRLASEQGRLRASNSELAAVRLMRRDLFGVGVGDYEDVNGAACWRAAGCPDRIVLMYARSGRGIVGCCIAEPIRRAYRIVLAGKSGEVDTGCDGNGVDGTLLAFYCSETVARANCGIRQIWCRHNERRSGVATALLDAAREALCPGLVPERRRVAFCSPSPDGYQLARNYVGGDQWVLVY